MNNLLNKTTTKKLSSIYNDVYILNQNNPMNTKLQHIEVTCPCCHQSRLVRKTLLSDNNKDKLKSTLCINCSNKSKIIFYKESQNDTYSCFILNGHKCYIDDEDINLIEYKNLQLSRDGKYVYVNDDEQSGLLHRLITNADKKNIVNVDHINHNTFDNRKKNLRFATHQENIFNSKLSSNSKTGFDNISICNRKQKWFCQYRLNNKRVTKRFYKFMDAYNFIHNEKNRGNFSYDIFNDSTLHLEYAGIEFDDVANGTGLGLVFFTQYCPHHCKGCQNPQTWERNKGIKFTEDVFNQIINYYKQTPFANRLTISGGEPFENLIIVNYIVAEFKRLYPQKKVWIYTGYLFEDLVRDIKNFALLEMTDYLVDGKFEIEKRNVALQFRGSSNQRIIDVQKTLEKGEIVLYEQNS